MRAGTRLILAIAITAATAMAQDATQVQQWSVQGTAPLTLTVPAEQAPETVWARTATGDWRQLPAHGGTGTLAITLSPHDMAGGSTLLVIDPPGWLALEDDGPPAVQRFTLDGEDLTDQRRVTLGWTGELPEIISLQVRDDANPINRDALRVHTSVGTLRPRNAGVEFVPDGVRAGTLSVHPHEIAGLAEVAHGRVELVVDDYAIDSEETARTVSWALSPSMTLDDGATLTVDSLTSATAWSDWSVIADGVVMTQADTTTRDKTWLSDNRTDEHWIRWEFDEPRTVEGVRLSWAYYQQWRTSRDYDVQVRRDGEWETLMEVRDQPEGPVSEHRFDAVETDAVRVFQMPMGGQAGRRDLMWLAEAEVLYAD